LSRWRPSNPGTFTFKLIL
jgi:DNA invertase Pin-like site-specific DNA recombinase